jgi:hypothetical protein
VELQASTNAELHTVSVKSLERAKARSFRHVVAAAATRATLGRGSWR